MNGQGQAAGRTASSHYFALPAGSKLVEFKIVSVLGHGGFGITYLATDTLLQEAMAISNYSDLLSCRNDAAPFRLRSLFDISLNDLRDLPCLNPISRAQKYFMTILRRRYLRLQSGLLLQLQTGRRMVRYHLALRL